MRFRKKYTEKELKEVLEEAKFEVIYKMYTKELDRDKNWVTYIIKKRN